MTSGQTQWCLCMGHMKASSNIPKFAQVDITVPFSCNPRTSRFSYLFAVQLGIIVYGTALTSSMHIPKSLRGYRLQILRWHGYSEKVDCFSFTPLNFLSTHVNPCTAFPSLTKIEKILLPLLRMKARSYPSPASEISSVQRPTWLRYKRKSCKYLKVIFVNNTQNHTWPHLKHRNGLVKHATIIFPCAR